MCEGKEGVESLAAYVFLMEIDEATLLDSCVIWIVFPRFNGLLPGAWVAGHYMKRLGETEKQTEHSGLNGECG